jgi:hypothetical protein
VTTCVPLFIGADVKDWRISGSVEAEEEPDTEVVTEAEAVTVLPPTKVASPDTDDEIPEDNVTSLKVALLDVEDGSLVQVLYADREMDADSEGNVGSAV